MSNASNKPSNIEHSSTFNKFMRGIHQIKPTARGMWSEDELSAALKEIAELNDILSHELKTRKFIASRHH